MAVTGVDLNNNEYERYNSRWRVDEFMRKTHRMLVTTGYLKC
jgi:hypothetical protein